MSPNGWLNAQLSDSREAVEDWPDWMKESSQSRRYEQEVRAANSQSDASSRNNIENDCESS